MALGLAFSAFPKPFSAFPKLLGWSYQAERSLQVLLGPRIVVPYRVVFAAMLVVSPLAFGPAIGLIPHLITG